MRRVPLYVSCLPRYLLIRSSIFREWMPSDQDSYGSRRLVPQDGTIGFVATILVGLQISRFTLLADGARRQTSIGDLLAVLLVFFFFFKKNT